MYFGLHGGAQWPGGAIDPHKHELFIPTNNRPWKLRLYLQSMEQPNKNFIKDKKTLNIYYEKVPVVMEKIEMVLKRNLVKN